MTKKIKAVPKIEPRFRISLGKRFAFGPGKADLLETLARTGSIAEAAKTMGMSYMRAWMLVKGMNGTGAGPLVVAARGGNGRGGATLTAAGKEILRLYRNMEKRSMAATRAEEDKLGKLLRG